MFELKNASFTLFERSQKISLNHSQYDQTDDILIINQKSCHINSKTARYPERKVAMKVLGFSVKKIPFYDDAHEKMLILNSRSWQETLRTVSVILLLLFFVIMDTAAQFTADSFYAKNVRNSADFANKPIFDLVLSIVPVRVRLNKIVCDVSIFMLASIALLSTVIFNSRQKVVPFQGLTVLRRFCFIQSIAYLFHTLTIPFTLVPSLNPECFIRTTSSDYSSMTLAKFVQLAFGQTIPCVDNSFSITVTLTSNLAFFTLAYSWNRALKLYSIAHATLTILLLSLCHYHYSLSISLGLMASVFVFGTYHLLLLVFCQSKIFLGVADSASMGFDLFFLNGFFCKNATRIIEWVDGLDLRQLQPFVADFDKEDTNKSLLTSAKELIP